MAMTKRTKGALWLLIGPTALLIATFILFAIVNWMSVAFAAPSVEGELFSETPIWASLINVVLFIVGTLSVVTWLPGLIVGIVLLASPKK